MVWPPLADRVRPARLISDQSGDGREDTEHRAQAESAKGCPSSSEHQDQRHGGDCEGHRICGSRHRHIEHERSCWMRRLWSNKVCRAKNTARLAITPTTAAVTPVRAADRCRLLRSDST